MLTYGPSKWFCSLIVSVCVILICTPSVRAQQFSFGNTYELNIVQTPSCPAMVKSRTRIKRPSVSSEINPQFREGLRADAEYILVYENIGNKGIQAVKARWIGYDNTDAKIYAIDTKLENDKSLKPGSITFGKALLAPPPMELAHFQVSILSVTFTDGSIWPLTSSPDEQPRPSTTSSMISSENVSTQTIGLETSVDSNGCLTICADVNNPHYTINYFMRPIDIRELYFKYSGRNNNIFKVIITAGNSSPQDYKLYALVTLLDVDGGIIAKESIDKSVEEDHKNRKISAKFVLDGNSINEIDAVKVVIRVGLD